jgi:ribonuclease HI
MGNPGPGWWACILRFGAVKRNADLWMELDALVGIHKTNWICTKGHAADEDNNRCDWLAKNAAQSQTFGVLSQTPGDLSNTPRQMQLALKVYF